MTTPAVTFRSITFSDGTTIELDVNDVIAIVGPNNSGKSQALQELYDHFKSPKDSKVVVSVEFLKTGTKQEFSNSVSKNFRVKSEGESWSYRGPNLNYHTTENPEQLWPTQIGTFRTLFCLQIPTETRITASNPPDAIDVYQDPYRHPIHLLFSDDELELEISDHFRRAFGEDLILDRIAGKNWPLLVGSRNSPLCGEDRVSRTYVERLRSQTESLEQQGDGMRSFASVVLHLLAPTSRSLLLLDEPEAFLHPSQARLLGEIIAAKKHSPAQLFAATHSPDVLQGLISVVPENLRILRMQRDGNVNRIKELDTASVKEISSDPLMKFSSVMSGLFHERVIVCESDADCMFYSSILDLPEIHGETHPDVLFVHASGKARMAKIAKILVALDVPVDVIADIDVLRDLHDLKNIIEALNGDWARIGQLADLLKKEVENNLTTVCLEDMKARIAEVLESTADGRSSVRNLKASLDECFRESTPWGAIKRAGKNALPRGDATQRFDELQRLCGRAGLWIVPVGELEGFCPSTGRKGPAWVQQVIEERNLATDLELESAREFISRIWENRHSHLQSARSYV